MSKWWHWSLVLIGTWWYCINRNSHTLMGGHLINSMGVERVLKAKDNKAKLEWASIGGDQPSPRALRNKLWKFSGSYYIDGNLAFMQKNKQVCKNKGKQTETVNTQIKGCNVDPSLTKQLIGNKILRKLWPVFGSLRSKVIYFSVF